MRALVVAAIALLAGCPGQRTLCLVERDGEEVIRFQGRLPDASCATYAFREFLSVHVERGLDSWDWNVPWDDAEAAVDSDVLWKDERMSCGPVKGSSRWEDGPGYAFSTDFICAGARTRAHVEVDIH